MKFLPIFVFLVLDETIICLVLAMGPRSYYYKVRLNYSFRIIEFIIVQYGACETIN